MADDVIPGEELDSPSDGAADPWVAGIQQLQAKARKEQQAALEALGEPQFIQDERDGLQYGYWKTDLGVVRMLRYAKDLPWLHATREIFTWDTIKVLKSL